MFISTSGFMISGRKFVQSTLSMLKIGEVAPDFELKNFQGKSFKLSSFKGKKPVVVFFYPADNTPGCTTEVYGV
jgi:peroxiredoxin